VGTGLGTQTFFLFFFFSISILRQSESPLARITVNQHDNWGVLLEKCFEVCEITVRDLPLTMSLCMQHIQQKHPYAEITVNLQDVSLG